MGRHDGPVTGDGRKGGPKLGTGQLTIKDKDGVTDLKGSSAAFGTRAIEKKAEKAAKEAAKERVYVERAEQRRTRPRFFS